MMLLRNVMSRIQPATAIELIAKTIREATHATDVAERSGMQESKRGIEVVLERFRYFISDDRDQIDKAAIFT